MFVNVVGTADHPPLSCDRPTHTAPCTPPFVQGDACRINGRWPCFSWPTKKMVSALGLCMAKGLQKVVFFLRRFVRRVFSLGNDRRGGNNVSPMLAYNLRGGNRGNVAWVTLLRAPK